MREGLMIWKYKFTSTLYIHLSILFLLSTQQKKEAKKNAPPPKLLHLPHHPPWRRTPPLWDLGAYVVKNAAKAPRHYSAYA